MNKATFFLIPIFLLYSCKKESEQPSTIITDLAIVQANTPSTLQFDTDIISAVKCSGNDLCYRFLNFDIKQTTNNTFEVRAKGTYPNAAKADIICLQAVYYKDTTLKITPSIKGQYLIQFYNQSLLFKTDTVQVN